MKPHPCNLTNIFIMIKLWHQRKQAFFYFFFLNLLTQVQNLKIWTQRQLRLAVFHSLLSAKEHKQLDEHSLELTTASDCLARCQMTSRGHRFPEQREGLGDRLLLDLCSLSKWETVSFRDWLYVLSGGLLRAERLRPAPCWSCELHPQSESSSPRCPSYFQEYIIQHKIIQLMSSYVSKAQINRAQYSIIQYKTAF